MVRRDLDSNPVRFTYRMPEDVNAFVESVASSLNISCNSALNIIVRQYMAEHPDHISPIYIDQDGRRSTTPTQKCVSISASDKELVNYPVPEFPVPAADDVIRWNNYTEDEID